MIVTYYAIVEFNESSQQRGEIVLEGIAQSFDDKIYPRVDVDIEEFPFECKLCEFKAKGYILESCKFVITRDHVIQNRTVGDRIF